MPLTFSMLSAWQCVYSRDVLAVVTSYQLWVYVRFRDTLTAETILNRGGGGAGQSAVMDRSALPMKSHPLCAAIRKMRFGFEPTGYDPNPLVKAARTQLTIPVPWEQLDVIKGEAVLRVARALNKTLRGSKVEGPVHSTLGPLYTVRSSSGKKYTMELDARVIEAGTPPAQLGEVKRTLRPLFVAYRKAGVIPEPDHLGGGHIHVDNTPLHEGSLAAAQPPRR